MNNLVAYICNYLAPYVPSYLQPMHLPTYNIFINKLLNLEAPIAYLTQPSLGQPNITYLPTLLIIFL